MKPRIYRGPVTHLWYVEFTDVAGNSHKPGYGSWIAAMNLVKSAYRVGALATDRPVGDAR